MKGKNKFITGRVLKHPVRVQLDESFAQGRTFAPAPAATVGRWAAVCSRWLPQITRLELTDIEVWNPWDNLNGKWIRKNTKEDWRQLTATGQKWPA